VDGKTVDVGAMAKEGIKEVKESISSKVGK
jgi:hypothetical protein